VELKKGLAKKFLPKILGYLHERDWRISVEGDLIFVDSEGVQVFTFGSSESRRGDRVEWERKSLYF
jgi:hypothetical protein